MAIRVPFFLFGALAIKMLAKFLLVQEGGLDTQKCVCWAQMISYLDCAASFHRDDLLAGWLRSLALIDRILMVM